MAFKSQQEAKKKISALEHDLGKELANPSDHQNALYSK
jgi:hypothetical protein